MGADTAGLLRLLTLTAGLLTLTAGLPAQQEAESAASAAVGRQLAASEELSQLLELAVQRVLDRRPVAADRGQLERLQHRLDVLELRMTALTAGDRCEAGGQPRTGRESESEVVTELTPGPGSWLEPQPQLQLQLQPQPQPPQPQPQPQPPQSQPQLQPQPQPQPEPEPQPQPEPEPESQSSPEPEPELEPKPICEKSPSPLPADQAPHQRPAVLACAQSCLQLRNEAGSPQDGVYWFTNMTVPTLCDFSHDGGGWTLLLTAKSRDGWNLLSVRGRRERSPSLEDNYSILRHADAIRELGTGGRFAYRIETQAEKGRQRWGGIWLAPRSYSFVAEEPSQTDVACVRKFDGWKYKSTGIKKRMPWLNMFKQDAGSSSVVLTTTDGPITNGWGSLLYDEGSNSYQHSPWSHPEARNSGKVLYWVREEML